MRNWHASWSRAPRPRCGGSTLAAIGQAGVPTSTLVAPVIPAINDAELERILEAVAEAGVRNAGYVLLRFRLRKYAICSASG